jgi:hypothetical protein
MQQARIPLGQLLVDARILSAEQLEQALAHQKSDGRRLGTLLVEGGYVSETQLTQILSQQLSVPWASLHHIDFSRQLLNLVPRQVAEKYCLVPIYVRHVRGLGDTLYLAMDDPTNDDALKECAHWSGLPARAMIASPSDIRNAIRVYYGAASSLAPPEPAQAGLPCRLVGDEEAIQEGPSRAIEHDGQSSHSLVLSSATGGDDHPLQDGDPGSHDLVGDELLAG